MALTYQQITYGGDADEPVQADGAFSQVEIVEENFVIVGSVGLDLRGATTPKTVILYHAEPEGLGVVAFVSLSRLADGNHEFMLVTVDSAASSSQTPKLTVANFPFTVAGVGGSTATSTADGSVTYADRVAVDIANFKRTFAAKEAKDLPALLARDHVDPVVDSGHAWVDDMLHGWVKPWLRLCEAGLAAAKADPTPATIAAYSDNLAAFIRQADSPGLLGFHNGAIRSEWRSLRLGGTAWKYDDADGGRLANSNTLVTYPTGETVVTWSAYTAINNL